MSSAGANKTPADIADLLKPGKLTPEIMFGRFLLDIISLRTILKEIDQLIFQSFTQDKLLVLNEDNIIHIGTETHHALGNTSELECQPDSNLFFDAVGAVVLLDFKVNERQTHQFGSVESSTISFSQEQGNTVRFAVRHLNDELNPFFGIYRAF